MSSMTQCVIDDIKHVIDDKKNVTGDKIDDRKKKFPLSPHPPTILKLVGCHRQKFLSSPVIDKNLQKFC